MKWRDRIEQAKKGNPDPNITLDANEWCKCYIGENKEALKQVGFLFSDDGPFASEAPRSHNLYNRGISFQIHISAGEWDSAIHEMDAIDQALDEATS